MERKVAMVASMKATVRSNSAAASSTLLQISQTRVRTMSSRRSRISATALCRAAMRCCADICGHSPCPPSQADRASSSTPRASSEVICAIAPTTDRCWVASSRIGEVTGSETPPCGVTLPPAKRMLPSTKGLAEQVSAVSARAMRAPRRARAPAKRMAGESIVG